MSLHTTARAKQHFKNDPTQLDELTKAFQSTHNAIKDLERERAELISPLAK